MQDLNGNGLIIVEIHRGCWKTFVQCLLGVEDPLDEAQIDRRSFGTTYRLVGHFGKCSNESGDSLGAFLTIPRCGSTKMKSLQGEAFNQQETRMAALPFLHNYQGFSRRLYHRYVFMFPRIKNLRCNR
jgi:hypothetical protein